MNNTNIKNLDEVLHLIIGGGTPSKSKKEYWNGTIPWVSVKDMKDDTYTLERTQDTITQEGVKNSSTNIIAKNNIIISTRMGLGRCFINDVDMAINQDLKALIVNESIVNKKYLFYTLKSKSKELQIMGSGTTVKGIKLTDLKKIEINIPSLNEQNKIATLLSNYDNLIQNNTKRIKLLEEMAEEIYKEWFIRLRFPNYENSAIVDGVPEGWEEKRIFDFGKIVTGKTPLTSKDEYYNGDIPFIKTPDFKQGVFLITTEETLTVEGAQTQQSQYVEENSICVSCIGTVGEVIISTKKSQTNQQINTINLNNLKYLEYLYFSIKTLKPLILAYASTGATMGNLSKGKFEQIKLLMPDSKIIDEFNKICNPIFNEIKLLQQKNQILKETRDLLLPRVMSEKLDLENIEIV